MSKPARESTLSSTSTLCSLLESTLSAKNSTHGECSDLDSGRWSGVARGRPRR